MSNYIKSFWERLSYNERQGIEHLSTEISLQRKSVIFKEGSILHSVYIIRRGIAKMSIYGASGHESIIHIASSGDILSYDALLVGKTYNATATALTDVEMICIPHTDFTTLIKNYPHIEHEALTNISLLLNKTAQRINHLSYHSTTSRIATAIIEFAGVYGYKNDSHIIDGPIYRKDLAEYAGVTIESAIRTIASMKKKGIISSQNKYLIINDIKELTRISHDE